MATTVAKNQETEGWSVDRRGIPKGKCVDCAHCKFRYADDNWHCELMEQHQKCSFELE